MIGVRDIPGLVVATRGSIAVRIEKVKGEITRLSSTTPVRFLESLSYLSFGRHGWRERHTWPGGGKYTRFPDPLDLCHSQNSTACI